MNVLFLTPEAHPLVKTGGLADVAGALPKALHALGEEVRLMLPAYPAAVERLDRPGAPIPLGDPLGVGETRLLPGRLPGSEVPVWLVECPPLFQRPGTPYQDPRGRDWPDNAQRFALLSRVAALVVEAGELLGWRPELLHANDWQCGLAAAYLHWRCERRCRTLFTIHNLEYGGLCPPTLLPALGLPPESFQIHGVEFHQQVGFLKAGIVHSDRVTTVSPTYAREIQTPALGCGLDGLLRFRAHHLRGILNGVDETLWNPATDPAIPRTYDAATLERKGENKSALQREMGLTPDPAAPLLGMVARLTPQKGVDLVLEGLEPLLAAGAQGVILGSGDGVLERALEAAAGSHPGRLAVRIGYDEPLAHRIVAGADLFLVPSRFEPCGLTQLYALRYGTLPVVRRTGGLADSVADLSHPGGGNGLVFDPPHAEALVAAVERGIQHYRDPPAWRATQRRAMGLSFSWERAAMRYRELYGEIVAQCPTG